MNENAPKKYQNLKMLEARKIIIEDLDQANLLTGSEKHKLAIPRGERTGEILEPIVNETVVSKVLKIYLRRQLN